MKPSMYFVHEQSKIALFQFVYDFVTGWQMISQQVDEAEFFGYCIP